MPRTKTKLTRKLTRTEKLVISKQIRFEQFLQKQSEKHNLTSDQKEILLAAFEAGWVASNKFRANHEFIEFLDNPVANARGSW